MRAIRRRFAQCAAALAVTLMASGCALAGRTVGTYIDDKVVTGSVKTSLAALHVSHLRRVNVDVYEGTVYLSGGVDSETEKSDAEIAAWRVGGVEQVVNDLVVPGSSREAASALPDFSPRRHPLMERFGWVTRIEPRHAGGPELAYDRGGQVVATIYTLSSRVLLNRGVATMPSDGRPIEHVSIYLIAVRDEVPEPEYAVVLWHVGERAAQHR